MQWIKDQYTTNFICPYCGFMVWDNGYGGCDYLLCPNCGRAVGSVISVPLEGGGDGTDA